jgi:chromosome segregation ATPase
MQTLHGEIALLLGTMKDAAVEKSELKHIIEVLRADVQVEAAQRQALETSLQSTESELLSARGCVRKLEEHISSLEESAREQAQSQADAMKEGAEQIALLENEVSDLVTLTAVQKAQTHNGRNENYQYGELRCRS